MIRVGVFGANGFIGRHLVRALVARDFKIVCFGRHFPLDFQREFGGAAEMRLIDLHDDLETHTKLLGVTHVVQLINSSNASIGNRKVVSDIHSNLVPHVSFIDSCIMSGVRSFTFLSSGGTVYGRPQTVPITEDHPTLPLNSYGLTKLFTEQYLRMLSRDSQMGFNILRVANPYGPGQTGTSGQGLVGTILHRQREGLPVTVFGDGQALRDYLYIEDVVDAIISAIVRDPIGEAVNIGSSIGRSVLEVIETVERALGTSIIREHIADRATDVPTNILDSSRAERLLGWRPRVSFDEGVSRTVEWNLRCARLPAQV